MAFPLSPLRSEFDPPAETPLSEGGIWGPLGPSITQLRKTGSNSATSIDGGVDWSIYMAEVFYGNAEVWACASGGQLGVALEDWRVGLFTGLGDKFNGYEAIVGGALSKDLLLRKYTNGSFIQIGGVGSVGYPPLIGMRINGDEVEVWFNTGGGWFLQLSVTDTTYRGAFYSGIGIEDPTAGGLAFTCFGGGTPNRSQFFRWLFN